VNLLRLFRSAPGNQTTIRSQRAGSKRLPRSRPAVEALEDRWLPSALSVANVTVQEAAGALGTLDPAGAAALGLAHPRNIVFDNIPGSAHYDDLFVTSRSPPGEALPAYVLRFDWASQTYQPFVTPGSGGLQDRGGITFGPDGNLYVSSPSQSEIFEYDGTTGSFLRVYVSAGAGGLTSPYGIKFGSDGNLYVCSSGSNQILQYEGPASPDGLPPGKFLSVFVNTQHTFPFNFAFGPDNNLYVSCPQLDANAVSQGSFIDRYYGLSSSLAGQFMDTFVTNGSGGLKDSRTPLFDQQGNLDVADTTLNKVLRFQGPNGSNPGAYIDTYVSTGLLAPNGLAFGPDGNLYVSSRDANQVSRVGGTQASFLVTLDSASTSPVKVDYATVDTTAIAGRDYTATSGTITFPPGVTRWIINVPILDDNQGGPTPVFTLNLSNPVGAVIAKGQGSGTILDDDATPLNIAVTPTSILSGGTATVTLTAKNAAGDPLPGLPFGFAWSASGLFNTGTGSFGNVTDNHDGSYTATFTGTTVGLTSSITITASLFGQAIASNTPIIIVSPAVPATQLALTNLTPSSVTTGGPVTFTVTAEDSSGSPAPSYARTIHFTSSDPAAVLPGDYTFTAADHGTHAFSATLKTAGTQSLTATDTTAASVSGTITGISVMPGVSISVADISVPEGPGSPTILDPAGAARVGLSGTRGLLYTSSGDLLVAGYLSHSVARFDIQSQTYKPFITPGSGGLTYAAQIAIGPDGNVYVGDNNQNTIFRYDGTTGAPLPAPGQAGAVVVSGNPAINGGLSNAGGVAFGPDGNVYVTSFNTNNVFRFQGPKGNSPGSFMDVFVNNIQSPSNLTFGPDGNLYVGSDAPNNAGQVDRFDGVTGLPIGSGVFAQLPGPKQIIFDPQGMYMYVVDAPTGQVLRFQGPKGPNPGAVVDTYVSAAQGGLTLGIGAALDSAGNLYVSDKDTANVKRFPPLPRFVVQLSAASTSQVKVDYTTADATAKAGTDYVATSGTLVFAPGETTKTIDVPILDDLVSDPTETFTLKLSNPVGAVIARDQAAGTILDDSAGASTTVGTWSAAGNMATPRSQFQATLLASGKVLVTGGLDAGGKALASAELYDPATGAWTGAASMAAARALHTATLLNNGKVLVVGGFDIGTHTAFASAELYDPASNTWSPAGKLATARSQQTATLLPSGLVLVAGGVDGNLQMLASAELYNPATNTWSAAASMITGRAFHTATLLASGKVLVTAGADANFNVLASAEVYDPAKHGQGPRSWSNSPGHFCLPGPRRAGRRRLRDRDTDGEYLASSKKCHQSDSAGHGLTGGRVDPRRLGSHAHPL
jgi:sugar lactone lactonase YvrE